MRMRAGFISNSSTSSFVIFFGAPASKKAGGRGKKATTKTAKKAASVSEPSPQQCLQAAVEGAMESGWLDPVLKEMHRLIDEACIWEDYVKSEDEDDEEDEDEVDEEANEPQAKKRRGEKSGEKSRKSAREEKRWAAMRKAMTEHLTSAEPTTIVEYIESETRHMKGIRDTLEDRREDRREERREERREQMGDAYVSGEEDDSSDDCGGWFWGGGRDEDEFSDEQDMERDIQGIEKQIAFAKKQQSKRGWCVEFSCSNQDGEICEEAMHYGMMSLSRRSGEHMAVYGVNNE